VEVYDGASAPGTVRLGETTGTTYGGMAMYRSNQTASGQFFRCFSGPSRDQVFELDEQGTVKLGGTLPASPNISLNADGSASFSGRTDIGTNSLADYAAIFGNNSNTEATIVATNAGTAETLLSQAKTSQVAIKVNDVESQHHRDSRN
jgi:hypothetical protein